MGCGSCTSKSVLFILGLVFAACALLLWGVGFYVIATYHSYANFAAARLTLVPAVVALAVGLVFFLAGLIGCCGQENRCTLTILVAFLLALLVLLVGGAAASQVYKGQLKDSVYTKANATFARFQGVGKNTTTELDKQVHWLQTHLQCCGLGEPQDWQNATLGWAWMAEFPKEYPGSCCNTTGGAKCPEGTAIPLYRNGTKTSELWSEGCVAKVEGVINSKLQYILGTLLAFVILLVLGILAACVLLCIRRQQQVPYFSLN